MQNGVEIQRLGASDYKAKAGVKYVDVFKLTPLFEKLYAQEIPPSLILSGPKGIAKSLAIQAFAAARDIPVITIEGNEDIRRYHLIGTFVLKGGESPFVLGDITNAIEVANEYGEAILLVEEINAISPQMQKLFNPLCDFRRRIQVPEAKHTFEVQPGKKLWVVGLMNFTVYGGVYALNEDLKSRFRIKPLGYPDSTAEKEIVKEVVGENLDPDDVKKILRLALETRQNSLNYALSTRDVCQIAEDAITVGLKEALVLSSGKYEEPDKKAYAARVKSVFGISI